MEPTPRDLKRFWDKVKKGPDCWLWTSQLREGYGLFRFQGKIVSAHRFSYALNNTLNPKLQVCHTCDTPACVRPEHLFQGTAKVNSDDKYAKDRHVGTLTNEQVREIRTRPLTITLARDIAAEFGINVDLAKRVLEGTSYGHLPGGRKLPQQYTGHKLTHKEVLEIIEALKEPYWGLQTILAKKYGVTRGTISHINTGRLRYTDTV